MNIPKKFKLFSTTYNIVWDNEKMNDLDVYGISDYSTAQITLATSYGAKPLSEDRIIDTYYHEKVHAILDMMHERDLSNNEKFVDIFSKLLRQSDETSES